MIIYARDVIQDALEDLGVIENAEDIPYDDLMRGWKKFQTMCGGWRREGIDINELLSPCDILVDEITLDINLDGIDDNIDDNSDIAECLAANLAVRLAPKYGLTPSQTTIEFARRGEETMRRNALLIHMRNNPTTPLNLEVAAFINRNSFF